jgi:flagellar protein FliJ
MAFRFSLEAVLRLRRSYEQRERLRLLALSSAIARLRTALEETKIEEQRVVQRQQESLAAGTSGAELHLLQISLGQQAERRRIIQEQIVRVEQQVEAQQLAYREAQKNRKILENLRDRQLSIYELEQNRREQQALDDLFNMRRSHNSDETLLPGE